MTQTIKCVMTNVLLFFVQTYLFVILTPFFLGKYIQLRLTDDQPPDEFEDDTLFIDASEWKIKCQKRDSRPTPTIQIQKFVPTNSAVLVT